jgi:hypothetical protein
MTAYKNYVIKSGDTLNSIAARFLGSAAEIDKLVSLNRLRYPYIAEVTSDKYGTPKASGFLVADLPANSITFPVSYYINNLIFPATALTPNSIVYMKLNLGNGIIAEDTLLIDEYYAIATADVPANTVLFQHEKVSPPSLDPETDGLLDTTSQCTFFGSVSGTTLTVSSIGSGYMAVGMKVRQIDRTASTNDVTITALGTGTGGVGTYILSGNLVLSGRNAFLLNAYMPASTILSSRSYYVSYTFIRNSITNETTKSPAKLDTTFFNAIPFVVQTTNTDENVLVFRAPEVWPTGATGLNLYVGTSYDNMKYQTTIYTPGQIWTKTSLGLNLNTAPPPLYNSAVIGTKVTYPANTPFYIYEDNQQYDTQVLIPWGCIVASVSFRQSDVFYLYWV